MILATYLPCNAHDLKNTRCFAIETPEDLLEESLRFQPDYLAEELVVFCTEKAKEKDGYFYVKELPEMRIRINLGGVMLGDAFVMDQNQRELDPAMQNARRNKFRQYVNGGMDLEIENEEEAYDQFVTKQKQGFEAFMLPLWAPVIISKYTGKHFPVDTKAELTPAEIELFTTKTDWTRDNLLQAYYGKSLSANDPCWCGCGKKMKKCHGRYALC